MDKSMANVMYKKEGYKGILDGVAIAVIAITATFSMVPKASAAESRTECTVFFEAYNNPSFPIKGPGQPVWISYMTDPGCVDKEKMPHWEKGRDGRLYSNRMYLPELFEAGTPPACATGTDNTEMEVTQDFSVKFVRNCTSST